LEGFLGIVAGHPLLQVPFAVFKLVLQQF
jgi:hypothetical protein